MKVLEGKLVGTGLKIAVVVSRFNELISGKLLEGAKDALLRHDVSHQNIACRLRCPRGLRPSVWSTACRCCLECLPATPSNRRFSAPEAKPATRALIALAGLSRWPTSLKTSGREARL